MTGYNFCTLFDRNYATRGIALYRSLKEHCREPFRLTVLCMDVETRDFMSKLAWPEAELILPADMGDAALTALEPSRARREFCWTCPPSLLLYMLDRLGPGEIATYVDADLWFFSDPAPVYAEMTDKDIAIHGHRFSPEYKSYEVPSGTFNVGLIAIRNAPQGRACLARWRAQCLEKCELDPDNGYCGDQKYLDEWPALYDRLVVLQHPGVCVAPWNIKNYAVGETDGQVTVDGAPLIFYHYHALMPLTVSLLGRCALIPARGYTFSAEERRLIYKPYARALRHAHAEAEAAAPRCLARPKMGIRGLLAHRRTPQMVWG